MGKTLWPFVTGIVLFMAGPAAAQMPFENATACHGHRAYPALVNFGTDFIIAGCTKMIQSGLDSDGQLAMDFYDRARAYMEKKDYDDAIADFGQAIALNPKFAAAYGNRGVSYAIKKDFAHAVQDFSEAGPQQCRRISGSGRGL